MSALITRLGRRFREKPKSTDLNLPALPNAREILEDIEGCQEGDSVIKLASLIKKKGKQVNLMDKEFLEAAKRNGGDEWSGLEFLEIYQASCGGDGGKQEEKEGGGKRRGSFTGNLMGGGGKTGKGKGSSDQEQLNSYNKLKQFLVLFEKSEEILEGLEPQFRRVEEALRNKEEGMGIEEDQEEMEGERKIKVRMISGEDGGEILKVEEDVEGAVVGFRIVHKSVIVRWR